MIKRMQGLGPSVYDYHNCVALLVGKPYQVFAYTRRNKWHIPCYRQRPSLHPPQTGRQPAQGALLRFIVRYAVDPRLPACICRFQVESAFAPLLQGPANLCVICKNDRTVDNRQQPIDYVADQRVALRRHW